MTAPQATPVATIVVGGTFGHYALCMGEFAG